MDLVLIRHGLPKRDDTSADPPLTALGHEQSRRVADWLADERFDAVYSSTMVRAIETAGPYVAATGLTLKTKEGLCEFDRGSGAYVPMEELKATDYPAWLALAQGGYNFDVSEFAHDVVSSLEAIVQEHRGRRVVVFCHGCLLSSASG